MVSILYLSNKCCIIFFFQVHAFRCANGLDAGVYVGTFRTLQKSVRAVKVVKTTTVPHAKNQDDDINWTLRSKDHNNSKRELKQLVDLHGEKAVVHKVGDGATVYIEDEEKPVVTNGHTEVFENGVRIPLYRKGKPTRLERESFESDVSDNRSEVSESALRSELETLSQELRDIKFMLEKSTGITTNSEPGSPRDFEPVNVKVHTHTVQPDQVAVQRSIKSSEPRVETVVLTDEPVQTSHKENGYVTGGATQVRVNVPDYRNFTEGTPSYTLTKVSGPEVREVRDYTVRNTSHPSYEIVTPRPATTSYENWKKNTMERNAVRYSDLPERIQWKSRTGRASHVVSARPRSALPSWSTDVTDSSKVEGVEVRHHPAGFGPSYQRVSFNPRVVKMQDRKTQSLRSRGLSTTVAKPIDKVYVGRADAKHHSLSNRPNSANLRPSILVQDTNGVQNNVQTVVVEQNNNVVKQENDDHLLDVSGIDMFKETSSDGAVIRT